ncbi:MAG: ABC transporter ATP-binding protein [Planctomycetota bacterium]|jgi:ABC-2 type transport system ATP-binding protein
MIEATELTKRYSQTIALRAIDLKVEEGDMFGLIGPNGAGKTTFIRIASTLLKPTSGMVRVDGMNVQGKATQIRRVIGYMPDFFGVYEDMRVDEYLEFFAAAYEMQVRKRRASIRAVLELTDLKGKRSSLIGTLSRGMQQRLGLARVLVHEPKVLLLDEPASGLDPRARIEVRELLKELRNMGKTILISSHILADLADLCNKIALIEKGSVIYAGSIEEAMARVRPDDTWIVEVFADMERAQSVLEREPFVVSVTQDNGHLRVRMDSKDAEVDAIPRALVQAGVKIRSFRAAEVTLEDAFLRLTKGEVS